MKSKSYYSLSDCQIIIEKYVYKFGGECTELNEGCLGLGTVLLHNAAGKKTIVIQEEYLNEWSSIHTIRKFNKMPKKYAAQLEKIEQSEEY